MIIKMFFFEDYDSLTCELHKLGSISSDHQDIELARYHISIICSYIVLAYRPALRDYRLALRGYLVASLTQASRFALVRFARTRFALCTRISLTRCLLRSRVFCEQKNFRKKSVSQSTRNALKRIEMQKIFLPL